MFVMLPFCAAEDRSLYLLLSSHGRLHTNVMAKGNTAVLLGVPRTLGLRSRPPRPPLGQVSALHRDASKCLGNRRPEVTLTISSSPVLCPLAHPLVVGMPVLCYRPLAASAAR